MTKPQPNPPNQPPWWDYLILKTLGIVLFIAGIFPTFLLPPYREEANIQLVLAGFVFAGGREALLLFRGFIKALSGNGE